MARNIQALAKKLGATVIGSMPEYSAGAFGIAELANTLRERLGSSVGKRHDLPDEASHRSPGHEVKDPHR
jgi:hypothetical protein